MAEPAPGAPALPARWLELDGPGPFGGELKGKGELLLQVGDASSATLTLDYAARERLVVGLGSKVGIRLSKTGTLALQGGGRKDLLDGELAGEVSVRLTLARTVDVRVEQRFRPSGNVTALDIRIRL
ncbi:MAG TPA: hypothetical protein VKB18_10890 [Gemmatimonadota bacterium]|nr:hypothetical protein [Gemmatimonadota bacterium]